MKKAPTAGRPERKPVEAINPQHGRNASLIAERTDRSPPVIRHPAARRQAALPVTL